MSSERSTRAEEAYVWVWLPRATEPVVAGRVHLAGDLVNFNYGRSYLERTDAMPLFLPELPLRPGLIPPGDQLTMAGCIGDALPDAWGRRVIMHHLLGPASAAEDPAVLDPLTYMLESGSDRIGALDFQRSAQRYESRDHDSAPLEQLEEAAALVDERAPLSPALDSALLHGSSVGGARPKALLDDGTRKLIAKFSSSTDDYPVVRGEFLAMDLAHRAGLDAAPVELAEVGSRDALLVERFDRELTQAGEQRRAMVTALSMLGLDEMQGHYATYPQLAQIMRERFSEPRATLRELFGRIVFNILVGNTDDHARNHAAFWDGETLALTPAYDICPSPRSGGVASQAMAIAPNGFRMSQLAGCVEAASSYLLNERAAREIIDHQVETIESEWGAACDAARLSEDERSFFWRRQFLNDYAFEGY